MDFLGTGGGKETLLAISLSTVVRPTPRRVDQYELGLAVFVRSFFKGVTEKIRVDFRPIILVLSGVVAFGLLLDHAGLVVAAFALITLACLGSWEFKLRDTLIMFVVLILFCTAVFYYGLEVSMPLWPEF